MAKTKQVKKAAKKPEKKPIKEAVKKEFVVEEQHIHDKFCWKVGFVIIAVLIGFFVWILIEIL